MPPQIFLTEAALRNYLQGASGGKPLLSSKGTLFKLVRMPGDGFFVRPATSMKR